LNIIDVYYSVFYDFGTQGNQPNKVYKSNALDILHNAQNSDINLLPRHVNSAKITDFIP